MHRRSFISGAAAGLASRGGLLAAPALAQPAGARTLRLVPQANLTALDPVWTTASVTTGTAMRCSTCFMRWTATFGRSRRWPRRTRPRPMG